MALIRLKTWVAGEILTHIDLNGEFDNFINNASTLISPWTSNVDAGGFRLTSLSGGSLGSPGLSFTGDSNTGIWSSAADTLDFSTGGVRALQLGTSFLLAAAPEDSRTSTVDVVGELRSTTSSAPAAGIGVGLLFSAKSAGENPSKAGELDFAFSDVTAGSEDSYASLLLRIAGAALVEAYRFQGSGAFRATFNQNLTANRTYTLPDASVTLGISTGATSITSNFSTSSTTFVDVTGLSVTFTTGASPVMIFFSGTITGTLAGNGIEVTALVDGVDQGQGSNGLVQGQSSHASESESYAFMFRTASLSAGSHTIKIQMRVDSGSNTATLVGGVTPSFFAIES